MTRAAGIVGALVVVLGGHARAAPGWEVRLPDHLPITGKDGGELSISIATDRGLAISKDAPVLVDLKTDLALKKKRWTRADAADPEADQPRFAIRIKADAGDAGDHTVTARVRFWVCAARSCRPVDVTRTATVHVGLGP